MGRNLSFVETQTNPIYEGASMTNLSNWEQF